MWSDSRIPPRLTPLTPVSSTLSRVSRRTKGILMNRLSTITHDNLPHGSIFRPESASSQTMIKLCPPHERLWAKIPMMITVINGLPSIRPSYRTVLAVNPSHHATWIRHQAIRIFPPSSSYLTFMFKLASLTRPFEG